MVEGIHMAGCSKQNGQLLTLTNDNIIGSDCHKITHDVIFPPNENVSENITVNKVFSTREGQLPFWWAQMYSYRINFCSLKK